ncbi:hypothetical protein MTBBW1_2510016 [Desulfamplus magnetovallimortis]|uniref:Uncharacterized protein n=1 Tax=Desulfamplus magnetovallimortis TaxID=1246637 RepID=A0A1W1HES5_9BACT|nr:radical SAM protein [Desulfamplus magnetovallimortis]SLM30898.1 hypothetical protein MTBBW1_2510016 [Desulfamplus magnetovallimortis]
MSYSASCLSHIAAEKGWAYELIFIENSATDDEIKEQLMINGRPDLVAITFKTYERTMAFKSASAAKELQLIVVAGGVHPTTCPDDLLNSGLFNIIVSGDGLGVFEEILDSYKHLNGIIYGKNHKDRTKYVKRVFSKSQKKIIKESRSILMLTSKGCPYSCSYCSSNKNFFTFPLEAVVDEIVSLKSQYNINHIIFADETFSFSAHKIKSFRKMLQSRNLSFSFSLQTRADCFSEEIAEEMVKLGVEHLSFGIESASPKMLDFLNKNMPIECLYKSKSICSKFNLPFYVNLILAIPTQNVEDYEMTLKFVKDTKPDKINACYFIPFPGTPLFDYCLENDLLPRDYNLDNYLGYDPVKSPVNDVMSQKGTLIGVDYNLASHYMDEIMKYDFLWKRDFVLNKLNEIDSQGKKWIIYGAYDYFYRVLEMISSKHWENFLGYQDVSGGFFEARHQGLTLPRYDWNSLQKPKIVITTTHKNKYFTDVIEATLRNDYGFYGTIESVATIGINACK